MPIPPIQYRLLWRYLTLRDDNTAAMMDPSDTKNDGRLFGNIVYEGIRPSITDEDFQPPPQVPESYPLHPRSFGERNPSTAPFDPVRGPPPPLASATSCGPLHTARSP